jgi:hypothetical protein
LNASMAANITTVPAAHSTLFQITPETGNYYSQLYVEQIGKLNGQQRRRPGKETCKYCEDFHLSQLKQIDKDKDVQLGKTLEHAFRIFIEKELKAKQLPASCISADDVDLHMPDMKVLNTETGKAVLYFELKAIFRPFITIANRVNATYECYSNSLTLDLSNGKKLDLQRNLVENQIGADKVIYVYWYDLPCVKGIFWLPSSEVYQMMDEQVPYDRRHTTGDFGKSGIKRGATQKIYLPLMQMRDFYGFFVYLASFLRE